MSTSVKHSILNLVSDMVSNFLYYDRKEDASLGVGAIDKAVKEGIISEAEIVQCFSNNLKSGLTR